MAAGDAQIIAQAVTQLGKLMGADTINTIKSDLEAVEADVAGKADLVGGNTFVGDQSGKFLDRGGAVYNSALFASLDAMVTEIGAAQATILLAPGDTKTLTGDLTIPANVTLDGRMGVIETAGHTLTVNGPVTAGNVQLFDVSGGGSVVFGGPMEHVNVRWFGAVGDGVTDDAAAINAAAAAAGASGRVLFPTTDSFYAIASGVEFVDGQLWLGSGGSQTVTGGQVELRATAAMTSMVRSHDTATNTNGFAMRAIKLNGNGNAQYGLNLTRHSYGQFEHCMFNSATTANVLFDANFSDRCYFNLFLCCKFAGNIGVRIRNGANVNQFLGGAFVGCTTSVELTAASMGNVFNGVDMEDASVRHVYADAPSNKFMACHLESAPIGFEITANGTNTVRIATDFTPGVTTPVADSSVSAVVQEVWSGERVRWQLGPLAMQSNWTTANTSWDLDPSPFNNTAASLLRLFRHVTTSGTRRFVIYKGDGTATEVFRFDAGTGDATLGGSWNNGHLILGAYHIWVDATGKLRIKSSAPTSDTDGTVVGTQA